VSVRDALPAKLFPGEGPGPGPGTPTPGTLGPRHRRGTGGLRGAESSPGDDDGFSLIEALVALAVLAIATVGLMRAVEAHIDSTRAMERRTTAMWVAENRLAELEAGAPGSDQVEMMGQSWRVAVDRRGTDDPEIERVRVQVFAGQEKSALASLDGFVDGRKL
jgi:general secretion pathway protein I